MVSPSDQPIAPRAAPKRFALVGLPRTGTNWTMNLINSMGGITCFSEIYGQNPPAMKDWAKCGPEMFTRWQRTVHPVRSRVEFFDRLTSEVVDNDVVGVKLLYNHLCWPTRGALNHPRIHAVTRMRALERWMAEQDVLVIALVRENLLKLYVSFQLARRDGTWHALSGDRRSGTISLDRSRVLRDLTVLETQQAGVVAFAEPFRHLVVRYEAEPAERYAALAVALDRDPSAFVPPLRSVKQTSDDLAEVIENFDEVAAALAGTRFEGLLAVTR